MGLTFSSQKVKDVVKNVDLNRYSGLWYSVAKIPTFFEPADSYNVTAKYTVNSDGTIGILNESYVDGERKFIEGTATSLNTDNSMLCVAFDIFFWFKVYGNYWIIRMDSEYKWAVVSEPYGENLWILSRTKTMDEDLYKYILDSIKDEIDISRIVRTVQN